MKQVIWQAAEGHRYGEQLQFVSQFPAYVTDTSPQEIACWYRRQAEATACPEPHKSPYRRFDGIRPVLFLDAFEGLAWSIVGQQITVHFAART